MKKKNPVQCSILCLASMQTTRILFVILMIKILAELIVFYLTSQKMLNDSLTNILNTSKVFWISRIGCFLYCLAMIFTRINRRGSQPDYTLARLRISRLQLRIENYIYNLFCVLMLWASMIFSYFCMYRIYAMITKAGTPAKTEWVFTIWENSFLKSFMPINSPSNWLCLIVVLLSIAIFASETSIHAKGFPLFISMVYLIYALLFPDSIDGEFFNLLPSFIFVIAVISHNYTLEKNKELNKEKGGSIETSVSL